MVVRALWICLVVFWGACFICAEVIRLEVLFLWAYAGVVSSPFQVPWGPACAALDLSLQTPFDRPVLLAHFYERLGFIAQGPFVNASAHKNITFPLINA